MRKIMLWILALGLVISPAVLAANDKDKDSDKKSTDSAKAATVDTSKTDTAKSDAAKTDAKPAPAPSNAEVIAELEQMRALMKEQSDQIAQQQRQLVAMQARLDAASSANASATAAIIAGAPAVNTGVATVPDAGNNPTATVLPASTVPAPANPAAASSADGTSTASQNETEKKSPLSFRIGGAEFTPGGYVDFTNIFRTTNTGSSSATSFGTIPFSNAVGGHLTEFRSSAQSSRFNIKVVDKFGKNEITGYLEMDFSGNDATNLFVTANSHTDRLRLYWLDLKRGKWEFLGGQTWGLMTPNRNGVSPLPADVFTTLSEDTNVHVGIPWTRAAEFRAAYHFNDHFVWAAGIENPQQYTGNGALEVVFPAAFSPQLSAQTDSGSTPGAPNVAPDFLTKAAYDNNFSDRHLHLEVGGILTTAKIAALPTVPNTTFVSHSSVGGGVEFGFNFELVKNFSLVGNGLWGSGVGRYFIGLGPQFVVRPVQLGPGQFDDVTSMVHAGDGLGGFEWKATNKTQIGAYYGGVYFQRNSFPDTTSGSTVSPISCGHGQPISTMPCIGFGFPNSSNSANKSIQEGTLAWTQTFWSSEQHGKLQLVTQGSYLTRAPWFVAAGAPKDAHLFMVFVNLRYVLP